MGSLGPPEMIVLGILALLVFGPKKLPEIGRNVGAALREFRKASRDLMSHFDDNEPPRVRSYGRYNYEADAHTVPSASHDYHPDAYTTASAELPYGTDAHPAGEAHPAPEGDIPAKADSAPHNGHSPAAPDSSAAHREETHTTTTPAHSSTPAEAERNA